MSSDVDKDLIFEFIDNYDYGGVQSLLRQGLDPNLRSQGDYTPLHLAVEKRFAPMVELLLEHGADPGAPGLNLSLTPLHLAADIYSALALRGYGAKLEACNLSGNPPLHHVCLQGRVEGAIALLNCGAAIDALNAHGQTPPYLAMLAPENSLILLAVFKLAGYPYRGRDGSYTPLHHCVAHLKHDLLPWLLREGGNIQARDDQGLTVADYLSSMEKSGAASRDLAQTRQALGL
jgi:ankyrin repeat protein